MRYGICGIVLVTLAIATAYAQTPPPTAGDVRFEVASVKLCDPGKAASPDEFMRLLGGEPLAGSRFYQPCARILRLALFAFDLPQSRLRLPEVTSLEFFAIDGRASSPVSIKDMRLMVRRLLADRFAFRSHTEVVTRDVYTLVLAQPDRRLGPNARAAEIDCSPTVLDAPDEARRVHCTDTAIGKDRVMTRVYKGATMSRFAEALSGRDVVVDGTGLQGAFDLTLSYDIGSFEVDAPSASPNNDARDRALEKQLGLKLVRGKGPVEIRVVDHVERPTLD